MDTRANVFEQALALSEEERLDLLRRVLLTLDPGQFRIPQEADPEWIGSVDQRLRRLSEDGAVPPAWAAAYADFR